MSLSYEQTSVDARVIAGQYRFSNISATPIPLAQLKIRYYFSNEETATLRPNIYSADLTGPQGYRPLISGTTLTTAALSTSVSGADTYAEVAFSSGLSIEAGATGSIVWDILPNNYSPPDQTQSNDYSYNAAATSFTVWDHVAIFQGTTLVWGCVPQ